MEKMKMETPNLTNQNIEKIAELFPNCVTEGKDENGHLKKLINFDMLRQMLSDSVTEGKEVYEFTWPGKKEAIVEANTPIRKTLRPCKEESKNWDTTENLYIEGDNLEVLKLLQESYLGKVKMIYIDPPYNTGNDFIYDDNFKTEKDEFEIEEGRLSEDGTRMIKNTESNGRFHSVWCSMIYPRLLLCKNILADDGIIFISIDENEVENLLNLCNEIFSEHNYITTFTIASNSSKNNSKFVSVTHEYLVCFAKDKSKTIQNWSAYRTNIEDYKNICRRLLKSDLSDDEIHKELLALTKYPKYYEFDHYTYVDTKGPFRASDLTAPGSKQFYNILHPKTKMPCKHGTRGWAYSENEMNKLIRENYIFFGKDESVMPQLKNYLLENEKTLPKSVLFFDSQTSTKWMKSNNFGFDFPKAVEYIEYLISMYPDNEITIMDFFSGSATTAHAIFQANIRDNGKRNFILVQLPEKTQFETDAYKTGFENICEIGKERIRRAGEKIKAEHPEAKDLDIGFRVLKIDSSNMNDVYYAPDDYNQGFLDHLESNIKEDRTSLDLLFGCLLDWGLSLSLPYTSEDIDGFTVHNYNDGDLIACFDENISDAVIKEIAKRQPLRAVFRDSSFESNPSKINVSEIFKMISPDTTVKVI